MKYRNAIAVLVGLWFTFAVTAGAMGVFKNALGGLALPVGVAALVPVTIFLIWFTASAGFRRYLYGLNPVSLTLAHSWRVNGLVFLILSSYGLLPWLFSLPAGLGDMAVGITAPWAARRLANGEQKGAFIFWQLLGVLDLVTAVALGTTVRLINPSGPGMDPMTVLPLSLVPTFFVPLLLIVHVVSIAQARTSQGGSYTQFSEQAPFAAR